MVQTSTFQQPAGRLLFFTIGILVFTFLTACQQDKPAHSNTAPDDIAPPPDALFQKVPSSESNIRFANTFKEDFYNNIIRNPNFYNGGGVGIIDVNKDGKQDIILAGNDYGQQVETGAIDAGNGLVLLNDGKGNFKPVPACLSGFWASRDARSLVLIRAAQQKNLVLVGNNNDKMQVFELR